jgi:4-aminobutyrate aminotransferase/(S)-3-amino-2-methylpropionate transaminase
MFACEREGIVPDLITTAKDIRADCRSRPSPGGPRASTPHVGGLDGTHDGNPLAWAALAALDACERGSLIGRACDIKAVALTKPGAARVADPRIGDVRGRGAMIAIELGHAASGDPDPALTAPVATATRGGRHHPDLRNMGMSSACCRRFRSATTC